MKKIYYSTYYDTTNKICGYVLAKEKEDCYSINENQYKNALKKRSVVGNAEIKFHTFFSNVANKPVRVMSKDKMIIHESHANFSDIDFVERMEILSGKNIKFYQPKEIIAEIEKCL
jgi:hypothetical protein